ncbi:MAG: methyl-accepting chemotaxis protein [Candidatus Hydrogenedentes bacterium]|nr:methyl-accepting chemotaxis protein [Candidatus Hydrogenedentota bacterium]
MKLGVKGKFIFSFLIFGLVPMGFLGSMAYRSTLNTEEKQLVQMQGFATGIADKIDRNLFERYGDVQAFCLNRILLDQDSWYQKEESANGIVRAMNGYVDTYDIYYLTLLVDLEGSVIAVNSRDSDGASLDTAFIYDLDFSEAPWFKACQAGEFTREMPFSAADNKRSDGTFIEDVHIDPIVQRVFQEKNDDGLTLGFSAPAKDESGKVIGYWSNRTRFALVEDFFLAAHEELGAAGYPGSEFTLLDGKGNIIVDYDPAAGRGDENSVVHDLDNVLFNLNLVEKDVSAARAAVAGETGYQFVTHERKGIVQAAGYTHLTGALGFPGMNWSVLVRIPQSEFSAAAIRDRSKIVAMCALFTIGIALGGYLLGGRMARPLQSTSAILKDIATGEGDLTRRLAVKSRDEIGELAHWFNVFQDKLVEIVGEIAGNASQLNNSASGLSEVALRMRRSVKQVGAQSDSAAENVASSTRNIQSIAAGIEESSANANQVATAAEEVSSSLVTVSAAVEEVSSSMQGIAHTVEETATSVHSISAAIEELSASLSSVSTSTEKASVTARDASTAADSTADVMSRLGKSAEEISKVVDLIAGIAAQTNLLALNATIEAASAGEAGKGFAVVAGEVKELAKQTSRATDDIRGQVELMQSETRAAVKAIGGIVGVIGGINEAFSGIAHTVLEQNATLNEIARNVGEAARSAEEMARNVQNTATGTSEVARNAQEASQGVGEMTRSIGELAAGANEIAGSAAEASRGMGAVLAAVEGVSRAASEAEESADVVNSSAEELSGLASRLNTLVGQFTY